MRLAASSQRDKTSAMSVQARHRPLSVALLLALLGCGGSSDDDSEPEDESAPEEDSGADHDGSDGDASDDAGSADPLDAGPPPMVCVGIPDECSEDLDEAGCGAIRGCAWVTDCTGVVYQCDSQSNVANCEGLAGCEWVDNFDGCNGESLSCWRFEEDEPGCAAQGGCAWEERCGGKPEPCTSRSEADCTLQPGCYLVRDTGF
jgi:hypothetical protein